MFYPFYLFLFSENLFKKIEQKNPELIGSSVLGLFPVLDLTLSVCDTKTTIGSQSL